MSPRAGLSPGRVTALALEIVDRDGPDGLTLARVAESAGVATPSLYGLLTQVQKQAAKGEPQAFYLFRTKTVRSLQAKPKKKAAPTVEHSLLQGPANTLAQLLAPYNGKMPAHSEVLKVPAHTLVVSCPATTGSPASISAFRPWIPINANPDVVSGGRSARTVSVVMAARDAEDI